jgi:hypothetical protein
VNKNENKDQPRRVAFIDKISQHKKTVTSDHRQGQQTKTGVDTRVKYGRRVTINNSK